MKHDVDQRRKMAEKEILLPEGGPREIEEHGSHFEANDDQKCAKDTVHKLSGNRGHEIKWTRYQRMGF